MKLFFLMMFCCFNFFSTKGQDLNVEQTLSYINKQLNDNNNKRPSVEVFTFSEDKKVTPWNVGQTYMKDYNYSVTIEHGFLKIVRTLFRDNTKTIIEESSAPINAIDDQYDYNSAYMNFLCNNYAVTGLRLKKENTELNTKVSSLFDKGGMELRRKTETPDFLSIEFSNDNQLCPKIRNAFIHLLNLISKDPKYYTIDITEEKGPFATQILKDTLSCSR